MTSCSALSCVLSRRSCSGSAVRPIRLIAAAIVGVVGGLSALAGTASGQLLSKTTGTLFTSYPAGATRVQGAAPGVSFRGVSVSGRRVGGAGRFRPRLAEVTDGMGIGAWVRCGWTA